METLRRLTIQLAAAFHWQPSEIKRMDMDEAIECVKGAFEMGLLTDKA